MTIQFREFPKIARLNREVIVTEKIDGTNGQIHIRSAAGGDLEYGYDVQIEVLGVQHYLRAGSRNRWVPHFGDDNFGFGRWCYQHAHELALLGEGSHFGEWWGSGIQRGYGLPKGEKRFSLFNVNRWADDAVRPKCCDVVPVVAQGVGVDSMTSSALRHLRANGSIAAPGFMKPEGVAIFHTASRDYFKVTLEEDEVPKGASRAELRA